MASPAKRACFINEIQSANANIDFKPREFWSTPTKHPNVYAIRFEPEKTTSEPSKKAEDYIELLNDDATLNKNSNMRMDSQFMIKVSQFILILLE